MHFLIGFMLSVAMALVNLPFILDGSAGLWNIGSIIFWGALAVFHLVMAAVTIN